MRYFSLKYISCLLFVVSLFSVESRAQMFATEATNDTAQMPSSTATSARSTSTAGDWGKFYNQPSQQNKGNFNTQQNLQKDNETKTSDQNSFQQQMKPPAKQQVINPEDYKYKNIPQINRPTLDGVKRGRTSVFAITSDPKKTGEGYIYLFFTDFSIRRMMSGSMSCDVTFQILTTLDRKLNTLAVRLKWPDMETPLSFIDVNPNQRYQMTYTLLGDGCYSMDKIPNVIINRCRVKGMSQEDCAYKVRWMSKSN